MIADFLWKQEEPTEKRWDGNQSHYTLLTLQPRHCHLCPTIFSSNSSSILTGRAEIPDPNWQMKKMRFTEQQWFVLGGIWVQGRRKCFDFCPFYYNYSHKRGNSKHGIEEDLKTLDFSDHSLFILTSLPNPIPTTQAHIVLLRYILPPPLVLPEVSDSISELIRHIALAAIRSPGLRETFPSISPSTAYRSLNGN